MRFNVNYLAVLVCVLVVLPAFQVAAQTRTQCIEQALSELEKVFCEVKASRYGASLPALHDFRRNPPQTQALLLKRPAQRLGLKLPKTAQRKPTPSSPAPSTSKRTSSADNTPRVSRLDRSCQLLGERLQCRGLVYLLVNNLPNRSLNPDALSANNRLLIPAYQGSLQDSAAVQQYLLSVYPVYLQKMLDIGLGASTMSFTKFFHTFQEVSRLEAPFASRMASMYEHLKKDKQSIATQARYGKKHPEDLNQCDAIGLQFIVCDDVKHNWVYVAQ